jgi:hypothetical protein
MYYKIFLPVMIDRISQLRHKVWKVLEYKTPIQDITKKETTRDYEH